MVDQQGEQIVQIHEDTTVAKENIERADDELHKALNAEDKYSKCYSGAFCFAICCVLILFVSIFGNPFGSDDEKKSLSSQTLPEETMLFFKTSHDNDRKKHWKAHKKLPEVFLRIRKTHVAQYR